MTAGPCRIVWRTGPDVSELADLVIVFVARRTVTLVTAVGAAAEQC